MYKPIDADVIIVGGGVAGLTAAHFLNLKESTLNVLVLEGSGRVGGRAFSVPLLVNDGRRVSYFDIGAQWVCKEQNQLFQLLDELGIHYQQASKQGKIVTRYQNTFTCERHAKGHFSFFNSADKFQFAKFIIKVEILSRKLKTSETSKDIVHLKDENLEDFINNTVSSEAVRAVIRHMVITCCGFRPNQVSALFYIFFCVATRGISHQLPTEDRPLFQLTIKGGIQSICNKIVDEIGRDSIVFDEKVKSITINSRCAEIVTRHTTYRCHVVIVAVPPKEIANITFSPPLPQDHTEAIRRTCTSTVTNFVATFEREFWHDSNLSGECYFFDKISGKGVIDYCASVSTSNRAALAGRICQEKLTTDKFPIYRSEVLRQLAHNLGHQALYPVDYREKSWHKTFCQMHGWQLGNEKYVNKVRQSYDRIIWAGAETTWNWYGCLAGAVDSGMRAGVESLYILRPAALNSSEVYFMTRSDRNQLIPLNNHYGKSVQLLAENWKMIVSVCAVVIIALWRYKVARFFNIINI